MYRKYREGELPDIQIKHAEIIRPFQALAQKDTSLARMLFSSLYESVFKQLESLVTERDAETIVTAVCDGINAVLKSSTQFYPPLIGSLDVRLLKIVMGEGEVPIRVFYKWWQLTMWHKYISTGGEPGAKMGTLKILRTGDIVMSLCKLHCWGFHSSTPLSLTCVCHCTDQYGGGCN